MPVHDPFEMLKLREYERGKQDATSIRLPESSYGATQSAYVLVPADSFKALRDEIRARRWRREGDNPGQIYAVSCELIDIHHGDYGKVALLKCSSHWDI